MGVTLKGLTTGALATNNDHTAHKGNQDVAAIPTSVDHNTTSVDLPRGLDEKLGASRTIDEDSDFDDLEKVDTAAPEGVQKVQAMTFVWSRRDLIIAYVLMWLIHFIIAFSSGITGTLASYVTSSFSSHSLTALTYVIASIVSGIWKLPYAKIMNCWGRPQALCIGVATMTLGLIMMAACKNVQTFCAAQTFYYVGYNSIDFSLTVFIADTSKLKNRGLFIAFASSPWLLTTFVYGYAVDHIVAPGGMGLGWGYGVFCIVVPVVCAPLITLFFINENKALKQGLLPARTPHASLQAKIFFYLKEFDVVGLLILATGLALFLLSFNLVGNQGEGWKSPLIICFLIFGGLLIIAFGLWEKYGAPVTFVPWPLLKNRTVIFTYIMAAALYTGWYVWDSYFYSLLIVLFQQPVLYATYISNTYTMGSCFICIVYGIILRYNGRLKLWSLAFGVPLTMLGVGLMIKFRQPDVGIGYIVMCQVFIAFGGGILVISEQTTLMAVSKQQDFPALLACESMVISIGSAIGSTIAGAMWIGIFPVKLMKNLPIEVSSNATTFGDIYGSQVVQSSYPWGEPTRDAINLSYAETQRYMLIAATCIYAICFVAVACWQDVDIAKMKQRTIGLL